MKKRLLIAIFLVLLAQVVSAQSRSVFWQKWDVRISNIDTTNNSFDVAEIYDLRFTGTFRFGQAVIPMDGLESIDNVRVLYEGNPLQSSCSQQAGTVCVQRVQEGLSIVYNFPSSITNDNAHVELQYSVRGALRSYEGGDQLWWIAVPSDHSGFSIGESTIFVEMPSGEMPRESDPVQTYGAPSEIAFDGNTIIATATEQISGSQRFEIRVQYPHNPAMAEPSWQAKYDRDRNFEEHIKPLLDIGLVILSILIAVGGILFVYSRWYSRGRDPEVGIVPDYLSEPPDELPPAVVGTLIDEKADVRDVLCTLIDLAHRGYVVIQEDKKEGLFGLGGGSEFTFKRTDKSLTDLERFENRLVDKIFSGKMECEMKSLKNKFYKQIPKLQDDLYRELVRDKLFEANPKSTRTAYTGVGTTLLFGAVVVGALLSHGATENVTPMLLGIPIAIGLVGLALTIAGQFMPAKTQIGAESAAKWKAFKEYLQHLEKYTGVMDASDQFDRYLPYAIAFGIEKTWINRFKDLETVGAPIWYFPTYRGGYYSRGYRAGTPLGAGVPSAGDVLPGNLARAGGGGLDTMAGNFSASLDSMASGLSNMLNSAASTMASKPSGSGGGGGWSGGGSFGGGGSGGGSRGFG